MEIQGGSAIINQNGYSDPFSDVDMKSYEQIVEEQQKKTGTITKKDF
jgi:hypothetical protein